MARFDQKLKSSPKFLESEMPRKFAFGVKAWYFQASVNLKVFGEEAMEREIIAQVTESAAKFADKAVQSLNSEIFTKLLETVTSEISQELIKYASSSQV
ncbi:MAG: hypothetical protein EA369_09675 [Bradymonadales bacterium]|nr:MAG: hypothetical protein EA369_09675 [Bradymonadales bacterium]